MPGPKGKDPATKGPREAPRTVSHELSQFGAVNFNFENIEFVTGIGIGCTRVVARPGKDADDVAAREDQIEVNIVSMDIADGRIAFDAEALAQEPNGVNRLISVVSEVSGIPRCDMVLLLYKDGKCDSDAIKEINPYVGSDVDARLNMEFGNWRQAEGRDASDEAVDNWWASKRNELDEESVEPVSIEHLLDKMDCDNFADVVILVTEEDSHLWQKPAWSDFRDPAEKSLRFALKTPPKVRGARLKELELECREVGGDDDWYILDKRSGGSVVKADEWALHASAVHIFISLNPKSLKTCGLVIKSGTMYELRARYIFDVKRIGERASAWSHKTGLTRPSAASRCRAVVVGDKRTSNEANLDDEPASNSEVEPESDDDDNGGGGGGGEEADVEQEHEADEETAVHAVLAPPAMLAPPPALAAPVASEPDQEAELDLCRLRVWLAGKGTRRPDFSRYYKALVAEGCDSLEMLFCLTYEELESIIKKELPRKVFWRLIQEENKEPAAGSSALDICPITQRPPVDPVRAADGHVYDRAAISQWLQLHDTSPLTHERLANKSLVSV